MTSKRISCSSSIYIDIEKTSIDYVEVSPDAPEMIIMIII